MRSLCESQNRPDGGKIVLTLAAALLTVTAWSQEASTDWIAASNKYTNMLLAVEMKHHPEVGSNQGLSEYDNKVSQPTLADEDQERQETEAVLSTFKAAVGQQRQKQVAAGFADRHSPNRIAIQRR